MSQVFEVAAAGFGLAGLLVVPERGITAYVRDEFMEPGWRVCRWKLRRAVRLPQVGPHQCLLCATPWATALVWAVQAVLPPVIRGLLLVALIATGMAVVAMVLAGVARPSPAKAGKCKACSAGKARPAPDGHRGRVEGASTVAQ